MNRYVMSDIYPNIIYDTEAHAFLNPRQACKLLNECDKENNPKYEKRFTADGKEVWLRLF